jgi:predicted dienelactone hydrolase
MAITAVRTRPAGTDRIDIGGEACRGAASNGLHQMMSCAEAISDQRGFSSGGFTALVSIGGVPDMTRVGPYCAEHRQDFACRVTRERHINVPAPPPAAAWVHDARIKAAVVAAPALSFTFTPTGLSAVSVPVQFWRAEEDEILPHPNYAQAVYEALPRKPDYHVVPNAGHFAFVPPCSEALAQRAPDICRDAPDFDRTAFHERFNAAVVAFFKAQLPRG